MTTSGNPRRCLMIRRVACTLATMRATSTTTRLAWLTISEYVFYCEPVSMDWPATAITRLPPRCPTRTARDYIGPRFAITTAKRRRRSSSCDTAASACCGRSESKAGIRSGGVSGLTDIELGYLMWRTRCGKLKAGVRRLDEVVQLTEVELGGASVSRKLAH